MKIAMSVLGFGALFAGFLQIPGVDRGRRHFLEPTFEDSPLSHIHPSTAPSGIGLAIGAVISAIGIGLAYYIYVVAPGTTDRLRERFRRAARLPRQQVVLRRALRRARLPPGARDRPLRELRLRALRRPGARQRRPSAPSAAPASLVRSAQSGFVRAYALLVIAGFAGLGLYFLIVSS